MDDQLREVKWSVLDETFGEAQQPEYFCPTFESSDRKHKVVGRKSFSKFVSHRAIVRRPKHLTIGALRLGKSFWTRNLSDHGSGDD
jgi:hypothetical protein